MNETDSLPNVCIAKLKARWTVQFLFSFSSHFFEFLLQPHQKYSSHSMKNVVFHLLLSSKMIILPILSLPQRTFLSFVNRDPDQRPSATELRKHEFIAPWTRQPYIHSSTGPRRMKQPPEWRILRVAAQNVPKPNKRGRCSFRKKNYSEKVVENELSVRLCSPPGTAKTWIACLNIYIFQYSNSFGPGMVKEWSETRYVLSYDLRSPPL